MVSQLYQTTHSQSHTALGLVQPTLESVLPDTGKSDKYYRYQILVLLTTLVTSPHEIARS